MANFPASYPPRMGADALWETAASYDRVVDSYEAQVRIPAPQRTAFRDLFTSRLRGGGQVLDAGCGPGQDAEHFQRLGWSILAVDASRNMVLRARERGCAAVVGDLRRLPVADRSLDGLWSSASLLHVPRPEVGGTFARWADLLRPGGILGLITSLGHDEGWEAVPYAPGAQHQGVPLRRWFVHHERDALIELVQRTGLLIDHVEERAGHRHWLQLLARRQ